MIRLLVAAPVIVAGEVLTTIGFAIAGASHLNPHRRTS